MTIGLTNGGGTMTTNNAEKIDPEQEPIPQPTASRRRAWFNIFITYSTKHFLLALVVAAKEQEVTRESFAQRYYERCFMV